MVKNGDVLWRVPGQGPNGTEGYVVRQAPFQKSIYDASNGDRYRGAQVRAVSVSSMTIRVQAEASMVIDRTVLRSLLPNAIVGDPCIVKLTPAGYDVSTLHDGQFSAGNEPKPNQAESVAAGQFHPSRITEAFWNL